MAAVDATAATERLRPTPEVPPAPPAWLSQLMVRAYPLEYRLPALRLIPKKTRFAVKRRLGGRTRRHVAAHRDVRIVAVTGSMGKTTTKELIAEMLAGEGPTLKTPGNANGVEGLPLTLRAIRAHHRFAVVEAGIYQVPGEMRWMASLFQPQVAVLTGIGEDHVLAYGSQQALAHEKRALLERVSPDGVAVVNAGDPLAREAAEDLDCRVVLAGDSDDADVRLHAVTSMWPDGMRISLRAGDQMVERVVPLHGRHFAVLVALAVAAVRELGVDPAVALARAADAQPTNGRMSVADGPNGSTLLMNDYKSRMPTARAALETLPEIPARRRIAVLGELQDRGFSQNDYRDLAELLGAVDMVVAVGRSGPPLERLLQGSPPIHAVSRVDEAAAILQHELRAGTWHWSRGRHGSTSSASDCCSNAPTWGARSDAASFTGAASSASTLGRGRPRPARKRHSRVDRSIEFRRLWRSSIAR